MHTHNPISATDTDFNVLFEATKDRLYRLFIKHIQHKPTAEDLLQDCYMKMWEKRHAIVPESAEAYLYQMAYHDIISWHRKEVRKRIVYLEQVPETKEVATPETALQFSETQTLLAKAIARLPIPRQHALQLIKGDEKTYKEAAAELNVPVSTLEKQVASSLKTIRKVLTTLLLM